MRARVYSNGGNSTGGFTFNGGQLTGALILAGNPSEPLEAASKQYVDSSMVNLSASNLTTGTLPSARLPSFAGDIVKPAGSSTINLAPIGITAGDYVKPTVDSKGRVTGGSALIADDITNLSWDKITTGKPTTLAGYGINDGISLTGGTLNGFLTFNGSVTDNMQAVTKQYVDVTLSSSSGIAIGDIIRKPYATTPSGFLKCNGAEVSKTTYNSLYATIGDRFSKQKTVTFGQPWRQQYSINEAQNADIGIWMTGTSLPIAICSSQAIVTKNRVYLIGGFIGGGTAQSTVYTALINSDGSLTNWVAGTALPGVLGYSVSTIIKNRIYLFGGTTDGNNSVTTVYTTTINADGTLGTWTTGTVLPSPVSNAYLIVTHSRVYICGGNNGVGLLSTVYYATISSDGTLGSWVTGTALPQAIYAGTAIVTKDRVYLVGGKNAAGNLVTTYTTTINADGSIGTWTTGTSLPGPIWTHTVFVSKNRVYTFGGTTGAGTIVSTVYTAPINTDGTIGAWTVGTSLPSGMQQSTNIVVKNRIYLLGAYGVAVVYLANISGGLNDYSSYYSVDSSNYLMPGSGQPWRQQYQSNTNQTNDIIGWSNAGNLPNGLSDSQVVVTKNRVYLLGGWNGSSYLSTVITASINGDGTLGTWTTGTSLPITLAAHQAIVTKNRVYLIGGYNGTNYVNTTYYAPINADGTLGAWSTGPNLPVNLGASRVIITKNRVYTLGGYTSVNIPTAITYHAPIDSNGVIGSWATGTTLQNARAHSHAFVTKNRVYLVGGDIDGTNGSNAIQYATINSGGLIGTWSADPSGITPTVSCGTSFITNNRAYIISNRQSSSTYTASVYSAPIDSNGFIGTWSAAAASLPGILVFSQAFAVNNTIYLAGGHNGSSIQPTIYKAAIIANISDYSPYYDGTIVALDAADQSTVFALPDLSANEKFDTVSYIKY